MQQFVIIYVDALHRSFNFARKPDKKYQLHSIILQNTNRKAGQERSQIWLQSWKKGKKLRLYQPQVFSFSPSSDQLLFFTDGLPSFPLLSITFSRLSKVAPKQFVNFHSNPILSVWSFSFLGPCVYIKEEEEMKRSQALFTLICFPLFAFLLATDCLLFDFCTFLLTT